MLQQLAPVADLGEGPGPGPVILQKNRALFSPPTPHFTLGPLPLHPSTYNGARIHH